LALLLISLAALIIGPLLCRAAGSMRASLAALDGFVMVAVAGLVVVHIIPHSMAAAGPAAIVLALIGFLGPPFIERTLHRAARQAHAAALLLAIIGLIVHAFFDGVSLAVPDIDHGEGVSVLAMAVVVHRLPIAITIWWLLKPSNGATIAIVTLTALGLATIAGYSAGDSLGGHVEARWLGLFQSLIAGSLLHVIIHRPSLSARERASDRFLSGLGALAGIGMVAWLADTHLPLQAEPASLDFGQTFLTLTLETAPALVIAFALAGMVQAFLPAASLSWMRTGKPLGEAARGVAFGLPLPICSCGVIPLYRTLIVQGVPATAAMAFLIATPELGIDAILISLPLLGPEMTIARVVAAIIVALVIGWVIGRIAGTDRRRLPTAIVPGEVTRQSWLIRARDGLRYGFAETVDHIGPWLLVGLVIASLAEPMLRGEWLTMLPWGVDVVLFAILGMPSYVCASGATPLAAVLIHKGVSPGAALAFLLAGPATNVTTFGVLRDLHSRRTALLFAAAIAGLAIGLGLGLNLVLTDVDAISLHDIVHEEPSSIAIVCLLGLAAALAVSVLRQGPRAFVAQVLSPHSDGKPDHGHDDHGHDDHDDHDDHEQPSPKSPSCGGDSCC
jgi:uncharacterized membrane protein YraQ (UPF0718 family)